jgi:hypothetical protein
MMLSTNGDKGEKWTGKLSGNVQGENEEQEWRASHLIQIAT